MIRSKVKQAFEKGEVKSCRRKHEYILNPEYIINIKGTNSIFSSSEDFSTDKLNEVCYNLYRKSPRQNEAYFENKNLKFIVWEKFNNELSKEEFIYDRGRWKKKTSGL